MSETRGLVAILVADVVGYSRLAGADEDRRLARLRALRSDLIEPHDRGPSLPHCQAHLRRQHHRVPQRGRRSALRDRSPERGLAERNAALPPEKRIEFRVSIRLGDVVEESDGDLMGGGVNIAAHLEGVAKPGAICLSEQAYWDGSISRSTTSASLSSRNIAELRAAARAIRREPPQSGNLVAHALAKTDASF